MKKEVEEKLEFKNFIKKFYTNIIQLNKSEFFVLQNKDDKIYIYFPTTLNYKLYGLINLDACPKFKEWLSQDNRAVIVYNDQLDLLRKAKISDVLSLTKTDSSYIITFKNGEDELKFEIKKLNNFINDIPEIIYEIKKDISENQLENNDVITVYNDNGDIKFGFEPEKDIIFEYVIKELEVIFKPNKLDKNGNKIRADAEYKFYSSSEDENGLKYVMIEGCIPNECALYQIFKTI